MIEDMEQKVNYSFIERTQKLLEQYDKVNLPPEEKYEVTLLLNACVGLLFICREKFNDKLPNKAARLADVQNCVTICRVYDDSSKTVINESKTVASICRHLRNSIAHCNFSFNSAKQINRKKVITSIIFRDSCVVEYRDKKNKKRKKVEKTFHAEIDIMTLREFLLDVSTQTMANAKH